MFVKNFSFPSLLTLMIWFTNPCYIKYIISNLLYFLKCILWTMQKIIVYKTVKQWMVVVLFFWFFWGFFSSFSINLAHLNKQHRLTKVFYKVKKKVQFRCRICSIFTSWYMLYSNILNHLEPFNKPRIQCKDINMHIKEHCTQ